jgi:hypothetical protein
MLYTKIYPNRQKNEDQYRFYRHGYKEEVRNDTYSVMWEYEPAGQIPKWRPKDAERRMLGL